MVFKHTILHQIKKSGNAIILVTGNNSDENMFYVITEVDKHSYNSGLLNIDQLDASNIGKIIFKGLGDPPVSQINFIKTLYKE